MPEYLGKTIIRIECPDEREREALLQQLRIQLQLALADQPEVLSFSLDRRSDETVLVTLALRASEDEFLDEVTDRVFDRALHAVAAEEKRDDSLSVLETALTPA